MKKLSALLLALVLAATLCFGAMAEAVDYTGTWSLTGMLSGETSLDPTALGMSATMVLNADGTCTLTTMGMEESGTWTAVEGGISMTDAAGDTDTLTYADGALSMTEEGVTLVFTPAEEYAEVLTGLAIADFNGNWTLTHAETTFGTYTVEEMGIGMTIGLQDGKGHIEMSSTEGTEAYDCECEIEEIADFGTVMYAMFLDATTGERDGSGIMLMLFDDGQLVWYDYDDEGEYFYCFDLVTE